MKISIVAAAMVLCACLSATASAATRRVAIVIGSERGARDQPRLQFATVDAARVSEALIEVGDVDPGAMHLLQNPSLRDLDAALAAVGQTLSAWRAAGDDNTVFLFYFSGHSDGEAINLGNDRVPFGALRRRMGALGARIRIEIIDSCYSGALPMAKGGKPAPPFAIVDELDAEGVALLASASAHELSFEAPNIRSSFFTHFFVSALRGAADVSGDGRVTLGEAFEFARDRTVAASADTLTGIQHPRSFMNLESGSSFVLSSVRNGAAFIELPDGFERLLISRKFDGSVVAEVPNGKARRIAVGPGRYDVRGWRAGVLLRAPDVAVTAGVVRAIAPGEMRPTTVFLANPKGGLPGPTVRWSVGLGVQRSMTPDVPIEGSLRLGVRAAAPTGWMAVATLSTGPGSNPTTGVRQWETQVSAFGGYRLGFERGRLSMFGALLVGAGAINQASESGRYGTAPAIYVAPAAGIGVRVAPRAVLMLDVQINVGWVRETAPGASPSDAIKVLPAGCLGVSIDT